MCLCFSFIYLGREFCDMPYLHLAGIPCVLDGLDPADVGNAPVKERAGLANKHTQSQRRPVRLCRRERGVKHKGNDKGKLKSDKWEDDSENGGGRGREIGEEG